MEENTGNSTESARVIGRPFPKGVSGNPSGRPKDTLKAFVAREFRDMNDDQKREWLKEHKISGIDQWKMGEGNPESSTDITSGGESLNPILVKFIDAEQDTNGGDTDRV